MIEVSAELTERRLKPIIRHLRPLWGRVVDALLAVLLLIIGFALVMAGYTLVATVIDFAGSYKMADQQTREEVLRLLTRDEGFVWNTLLVPVVCIPGFLCLVRFTMRMFRGCFDDTYIAHCTFRSISKKKGTHFTYQFSVSGLEIQSELAPPEVFCWTEFSQLEWLSDTLILKMKSKPVFIFVLLDENLSDQKREKLKSFVSLTGLE